MACRVGMTTDPVERQRHWRGQYPYMTNWQILRSQLTYNEALEWERYYAGLYGCVSHPGGSSVLGRVWSIYYFQHP